MKLRSVVSICCFSLLLAMTADALAQRAFDSYGKAMGHYHKKEYKEAHALLSQLVDGGSKDPRVYYFRGITRFKLDRKKDAESDFESGARLEAAGRVRENIPKALERVQGPERQLLEKYRRDAKRQRNLAGTTSRFSRQQEVQRICADARTAYFGGKYQQAHDLLDGLIAAKSQDPRVFYFRGLALHQLGEKAKAEKDFEAAIFIETGSRKTQINVDTALERVQGDARRALENKRQAALAQIRRAEKQRRREMVAKLVEQQLSSDSEFAALRARAGNPELAQNTGAGDTAADTTNANPNSAANKNAVANTKASSGQQAVDLTFLPDDLSLVVRLNVRELWSTPLVRKFQGNPMVTGVVAQMKQMTGLTPADIESLTIGTPDMSAAAIGGPRALTQAQLDQKVVVVARLRAPFDSTRLTTFGYESMNDGSVTWFKNEQELPDLFFPDSKTIVASKGQGLQDAIKKRAQKDTRADFDFLDASKQLVIGFLPDDATILTAGIPNTPLPSPGLNKLRDAAQDSLLGVSFGIGVEDSIELQFGFVCINEAIAGDMKTALTATINDAKGMLTAAKAFLPPEFEKVGGIGDALLRSAKSTTEKGVCRLNLTFTENTISQITRIATELGDQIPGLLMGAPPGGLPPGGPGQNPNGQNPNNSGNNPLQPNPNSPQPNSPQNSPQPGQPGLSPNLPGQNSPQPNSSQPNSSQPNSSQPNSPQPNSPQPNSPQPNSPQPNSPQPNSPQPNSPQPNSSQPNSSQPNSSQPALSPNLPGQNSNPN